MSFFGLGFSELVVIAIVTLIVVGPKRLPDVARTLGKGLRMLRKAGDELREAVDLDDIKDQVYRETNQIWKDTEAVLDVRAEPVTPKKPKPTGHNAAPDEDPHALMTGPGEAPPSNEAEGPKAEAPKADAPEGALTGDEILDDAAAEDAVDDGAPVARDVPLGPSAALKAALGESAYEDEEDEAGSEDKVSDGSPEQASAKAPSAKPKGEPS